MVDFNPSEVTGGLMWGTIEGLVNTRNKNHDITGVLYANGNNGFLKIPEAIIIRHTPTEISTSIEIRGVSISNNNITGVITP